MCNGKMRRVRVTSFAMEKLFLHIIFVLHEHVNNIKKQMSVFMETKGWFSFALFLSYELFHTAVNSMSLFRFSCKVRFFIKKLDFSRSNLSIGFRADTQRPRQRNE